MPNDGKHGGFDDFWDIASLIPARKKAPASRPSRQIEATEITAPPAGDTPPTPDMRLTVKTVSNPRHTPLSIPQRVNIPQNGAGKGEINITAVTSEEQPLTERQVSLQATATATKPAPLLTYRPAGGLMHEVRVYPWKNHYNYYEQFVRHALRYADVEGSECPDVDFFSYMPQYSQMNRAQLSYYFWWRTNFKKGVCLHASYAYLLLFLYEIINLADRITPKTGQEYMLRLWLSYRAKHPRLDVLIREWLCDYSLLFQLSPPRLPAEWMREMISGAQLKEFYVSGVSEGEDFTDAVLHFCSNYDYRKSKFYRAETAALYHRILRGAVQVALGHLQEKMGENATRQRGYSTVGRDTFAGAICSYRLKRHIEVDFSSFAHTHELRFVVTDVLKYAENALRAALGIKSRLTVYEVSTDLRTLLDVYLKENLPRRAPKQTEKAPKPLPEYERRYEPEIRPISMENAARIEENSWLTTKRLVEAFADESAPETAEKTAPLTGIMPEIPPALPQTVPTVAPPTVPSVAAEAPAAGLAADLGVLAGFLPLCLAGDRAAQRAFALSVGQMTDAVADRINTAAEAFFGDIVLEDAGGYYTVIEDYIELLKDEGVL